MNKQKLTLPVNKWGTIKSKYRPESNYVLNDELTAGSQNFITNNTGALEKRPTDVQYNSTAFSFSPKDQFEAIFSSGVHHLLEMDGGTLKYTTGDGIITAVQAGFTPTASMEYSMYQNRVYMDNGIDTPSVYDLVSSYGGVTYSVPRVKDMGAQPPASAPLFGANSGGGSVPVGGHTYVITNLFYDKEESNAGPASTLQTVVGSNQTINLTSIPIGGYGVTARNIYRDNGDGIYLLVGTLSDNTTTIFADREATGTTPIPTANDLPPVFSYITLNLSRNFVGGVPGASSVLYWSLPNFPDIFDPNNFIICNPKDPITGLTTFQGTTIVFNRHSFGRILGNTDDTFFYEEVPGTVGCVDNRSIQIRTINGVPVLVWLSDRGFYKFDGSSVTYISDPIEDLVNFNLQQVTFTTGSNNQSTQADFFGGTSSPSIDLVSNPNTITVVNPKAAYQSRADWEGGLSLTNIATADGTNQLKVPVAFFPTLSGGTLGGSSVIVGANVQLTTTSNQEAPDSSSDGNFVDLGAPGISAPSGVGQKFTFQHNGTIPAITFYVGSNASGNTVNWRFRMTTDALNTPGSVLYETTGTYTQSLPVGSTSSFTVSPAISVTAGVSYWFTIEVLGPVINWFIPANFTASFPNELIGSKRFVNGVWESYSSAGGAGSIVHGPNTGSFPVQLPCIIFFTQTPVASSGTWLSVIYDSASISSAVAASIQNTGSYPSGCSATLFVDMSNDPTMSVGLTTFSQSNPNGIYSPGLSGNRYWRIRYSLATTDNRNTPSVTVPFLNFSTVGTWISQPIDCTTDVMGYAALQLTDNVPTGTTVVVTIATSANNITYTSYGPVGSATVQRYVKVKVVLTATSDDTSTPSVSFLQFSWVQSSIFTSSVINVGQVPTGWGVFQDIAIAGGGTFAFFMRSASSPGALSSATYFSVSNGVFPPAGVVPLQYTQWKVTFTSSADNLPSVSGVTVNWFVGSGQNPIRAASLFFNKTYYLSAATIGSLTNNVVIVWDFEDLWRIFYGVTIASLGLFYNEPFYCDSVRNNIYQWLIAPTGAGSAISMDVRTKAYDLGNINILKNVRSLRVTGMNTGTTIHVYYSVDRGTTWIEMLNVNGTLGYTTSTNGNKFSQYFVADYSSPTVATSGSTIMFRVTSVDAFPCTILGIEPVLYSRSGKYLEQAI